jgi:hypothetical protein
MSRSKGDLRIVGQKSTIHLSKNAFLTVNYK